MSFGFGKPATPAGGASSGFGFGSAAQPSTAPAPGGFSFGGQNNAAQPAAGSSTGGGLFGSAPTVTTTAPASGGLFGSSTPAAPASTPTAGTGLFGAKPTLSFGGGNTNSATGGGGLFGNTAGQTGSTQPTGLFGQPAAAAGTQQASTGLFGKPAAPAGGGLFGQSTASASQPAGTGLFGAAPTNQPAAGGGLFGTASTSQPTAGSSLFGAPKPAAPSGGLFGQQSQATNANPLQASTSATNKSTKFSDLPEQTQKVIETMDSWIKDQKQIGASISTENIERAIWQTSGDVKAASDENAAIAQGLHSLKQSLEQLAAKVSSEAQDLQKLLETWEAAKPVDARHNNIRPIAHRDFPQEYFYRVAQGLEERVNRYKRTILLLTRAVTSLANEQDSLSPQVVAQTIQNNQQAILSLAGQLEGLELRMNGLRASFTDDYRERTNSMRDPFEVAREEKGLSLLRA